MVAPIFRHGEPQPYPGIAGGDTGGYLRYTEVLQLFVTVYAIDKLSGSSCRIPASRITCTMPGTKT